ncbi:MAG: hypothetical protein AAGU12_14445 [Clostridiales bacterium]
MAFFDKALELGKKVGETTASVAKSAAMAAKEKSEQAIEIGKLKKDIMVENGKITKLYEDIGKHAYDVYCSSQDYSVLEPLFLQISGSLSRIEECKAKIEEVKLASNIEDDDDIPVDEEYLPADPDAILEDEIKDTPQDYVSGNEE